MRLFAVKGHPPRATLLRSLPAAPIGGAAVFRGPLLVTATDCRIHVHHLLRPGPAAEELNIGVPIAAILAHCPSSGNLVLAAAATPQGGRSTNPSSYPAL